MKVSIKTTSGEAYQITLPLNSTIKDLKFLAIVASRSLKSADLNVYNLYFKGIKLDLLKTTSNYNISENDLIIIGSKVPEENVNLFEFETSKTPQLAPSSSETSVSDSKELEEVTDITPATTAAPQSPQARSKSPSASANGITKKKKSQKNGKKCNFANCNNAYLRIIGNCQDCSGNYCSKHRLMEAHLCTGLTNCKKVAFNRNANKLHQEQTITSKV